MERERVIAILQTITILILMSIGTVLTKLALDEVPAMTFAWVSVAIGMAAMTIYTFGIRRERIPAELGSQIWLTIIAIGICNFALGRVFGTLSLERLPATTNTYLTNFIGFMTMGMSIFILKESPTIFQVAGALVAMWGLWVFFDEAPSGYELVGVLFVLIAITAVAYTNNIARKLAVSASGAVSNNIISTMSLLAGGSITVLIGLALEGVPQIQGLNNWLIVLYSGVVMVGICLTGWNHILRILRSYEASILGGSSIIWTALLAVPILGERLGMNQMLGMALMLAGLTLVQVRRQLPAFLRLRKATIGEE